jgi:peptidoglycan/xylan/chitin deacetylase (PgdA/CDA1 family)
MAFSFTSDDGNAVNLEWVGRFRDLGLRYTMFVTAGWVGWPGKLTVGDLRALHAEGFEIGGHGLNHLRLTECDDATLAREMAGCRDSLEAMVGSPAYRCLTFAYPYQAHDERVIAAAETLFAAARNGGTSPSGRPNFSEGRATWEATSLYEVPLAVTVFDLTRGNQLAEEETRRAIRDRLPAFRSDRRWIVICAHKASDCDPDHLSWILEELIAAGDVWIAPFGEVAAEYRAGRARAGTAVFPVNSYTESDYTRSPCFGRDLPPGGSAP